MKVITWNCNMAFRRKVELLMAYQPDLLVIPECEHPGKFDFKNDIPKPTASLWFGENQHKGLGIFSYNKLRMKVLDIHNDNFKMIVPIAVKSGRLVFTLFAVWANNPNDPDGQYVTQVWKALHHYDTSITKKRTLLVGDFNSNTIWDKPRREGNHSAVVQQLEKKGIHSVYHKHFNQIQGKEQHPTLYMYRHKDKPYHIDYCFASADMLKHLESVEVGDYNFWKQYSDHVPVIVTFNTTVLGKRTTTMSIINKLASSLNRRDEVPNQELAKHIANKKDSAAVKELVDNLHNKSKDIQHDCIKVLYEIGEINPSLIASYANDFIKLLDSKDNRLQWGAMTTINTVAAEVPKTVYSALSKIMAVADKGSVITKDHAVNILIKLSSIKQYAGNVFPLLAEQLLKAPPNQLPMYAEKALPIINDGNKKVFIKTLSSRLDDMEKESKRKRVEKVITKCS